MNGDLGSWVCELAEGSAEEAADEAHGSDWTCDDFAMRSTLYVMGFQEEFEEAATWLESSSLPAPGRPETRRWKKTVRKRHERKPSNRVIICPFFVLALYWMIWMKGRKVFQLLPFEVTKNLLSSTTMWPAPATSVMGKIASSRSTFGHLQAQPW